MKLVERGDRPDELASRMPATRHLDTSATAALFPEPGAHLKPALQGRTRRKQRGSVGGHYARRVARVLIPEKVTNLVDHRVAFRSRKAIDTDHFQFARNLGVVARDRCPSDRFRIGGVEFGGDYFPIKRRATSRLRTPIFNRHLVGAFCLLIKRGSARVSWYCQQGERHRRDVDKTFHSRNVTVTRKLVAI